VFECGVPVADVAGDSDFFHVDWDCFGFEVVDYFLVQVSHFSTLPRLCEKCSKAELREFL